MRMIDVVDTADTTTNESVRHATRKIQAESILPASLTMKRQGADFAP